MADWNHRQAEAALTKPVDWNQLVTEIQRACAKKRE